MQEEGMNAVTEVMDELRKALAELEDCRARNADLRTMLEQVTRERDVETNSALMFECDWKDACRERDEARAEMERWRTSYDAASAHAVDVRAMLDQVRKELYEARAEIAILTTALDERDLEAERGLEQYDRLVRERDEARAESAKWKAGFEEFRSRNTDLMMHLFEAQEKVRAVNIEPMLHLNSQLRSRVHGLSAEVDRLMHQLADQTNETTRVRLEAKRSAEEAYRRGAEAMRDECIGAACEFFMGTTGFCNGDEDELEAVLEALPIPEEP
jgi:chromosome segregation ATPase